MSGPLSVLIFAEAASFAHVARSVTLKNELEKIGCEVTIARDDRYDHLLRMEDRKHRSLSSLSSSTFLARIGKLRFPYTSAELTHYVHDELRLLDEIRPDLVIGDFRLTLAISARLKGVPYASLANGYWLPEIGNPRPEPPAEARKRLKRFLQKTGLPENLVERITRHALKVGMNHAAKPFNRVARKFGVSQAIGDLHHVYTQADHILLPEPSGWMKIQEPKRESIHPIGPLGWESSMPLPSWWSELDSKLPLVLIALGSSGNVSYADVAIEALQNEPINIIVSGKPRGQRALSKAHLFCEPFLNSARILKDADLLISNGGSLSMVDALKAGCPVLGLTSNYDQILNMAIVEDHGVGLSISGPLSANQIREYALNLLDRPPARQKALAYAERLFQSPVGERNLTGFVQACMAQRRTS